MAILSRYLNYLEASRGSWSIQASSEQTYYPEAEGQGQTVSKEVKEDVGTGGSKWTKTRSGENRRRLPAKHSQVAKLGEIGPIRAWNSLFQHYLVSGFFSCSVSRPQNLLWTSLIFPPTKRFGKGQRAWTN